MLTVFMPFLVLCSVSFFTPNDSFTKRKHKAISAPQTIPTIMPGNRVKLKPNTRPNPSPTPMLRPKEAAIRREKRKLMNMIWV